MSNHDGAAPPAEGGNAAATGYQKRVRGGHRAHLTKVIADITTKLASSTGQEDSLRAARACLERKAVTLSKLDEEILVGLEDAPILTVFGFTYMRETFSQKMRSLAAKTAEIYSSGHFSLSMRLQEQEAPRG